MRERELGIDRSTAALAQSGTGTTAEASA